VVKMVFLKDFKDKVHGRQMSGKRGHIIQVKIRSLKRELEDKGLAEVFTHPISVTPRVDEKKAYLRGEASRRKAAVKAEKKAEKKAPKKKAPKKKA